MAARVAGAGASAATVVSDREWTVEDRDGRGKERGLTVQDDGRRSEDAAAAAHQQRLALHHAFYNFEPAHTYTLACSVRGVLDSFVVAVVHVKYF